MMEHSLTIKEIANELHTSYSIAKSILAMAIDIEYNKQNIINNYNFE